MKRLLKPIAMIIGALILILAAVFGAQTIEFYRHLTRVEASPEDGFYHPYYFYTPGDVKRTARNGQTITLLVLPNNTGTTTDDLDQHRKSVLEDLQMMRTIAGSLDVVILEPVFPRPESDWQVYTHALDRDTLTTDIVELSRTDLQLVAMIDDATVRLEEKGWQVDDRVLMWGFSASGMFTNRFTLLHPERVKAAVIGSPGGWPIAPVETYQGECLRYPVGICDVEEITGQPVDLDTYAAVPQFFFIGGDDLNDSVPYDDSYDDEDREIIYPLFGDTPVERWDDAQAIYEEAGINAEFHVYEGVGHNPAPALQDTVEFLRAELE